MIVECEVKMAHGFLYQALALLETWRARVEHRGLGLVLVTRNLRLAVVPLCMATDSIELSLAQVVVNYQRLVPRYLAERTQLATGCPKKAELIGPLRKSLAVTPEKHRLDCEISFFDMISGLLRRTPLEAFQVSMVVGHE